MMENIWQKYLRPGESVLWEGQLTKGFWSGHSGIDRVKLAPFVWPVAIAVLAYALATPPTLESAAGLALVAVWGFFFARPVRHFCCTDRARRSATRYAITNHRALKQDGLAKLSSFDITPESEALLTSTSTITLSNRYQKAPNLVQNWILALNPLHKVPTTAQEAASGSLTFYALPNAAAALRAVSRAKEAA